MTVFCCVYSSTLTFDGGKPRSISTEGTVSPTLMVFLPKGPAAAVAQSANAIKADRMSVPDENYTTLNTFWLLASVLHAAS